MAKKIRLVFEINSDEIEGFEPKAQDRHNMIQAVGVLEKKLNLVTTNQELEELLSSYKVVGPKGRPKGWRKNKEQQ